MKVKIHLDGEEKEIEVKNPKGRHVKKLWDYFEEMQKDEIKGAKEYINYVDEISAELSGLTVEQLDELDIEEKNKITKNFTEHAFSNMDFGNAFKNLQGSSQKTN